MNMIQELGDLIRSQDYRQAVGLPDEVTENYALLAQGEYNINYSFTHPLTGKKLVLRVNCGSQMHLDDQIEYEYRALRMLSGCGHTPEVYYVDGTRRFLDHGILVMDHLPGHPLDYRTELTRAAAILADIHSMPVPAELIPEEGVERTGLSLISPSDPLRAILEECEQMVAVYMEAENGDSTIKNKLRGMLDTGWRRLEEMTVNKNGSPAASVSAKPYRCCINTELNSTNFLINEDGHDYLIDWEKPLYGDPAQDLGHFLAPTTTFWKTDVILTEKETDDFATRYIQAVDGRFNTGGLRNRVKDFMTITCLRGITWCAMAWVEYRQPGRQITNESTRIKLDQYISADFLSYIEGILQQQ